MVIDLNFIWAENYYPWAETNYPFATIGVIHEATFSVQEATISLSVSTQATSQTASFFVIDSLVTAIRNVIISADQSEIDFEIIQPRKVGKLWETYIKPSTSYSSISQPTTNYTTRTKPSIIWTNIKKPNN